MNMLRVLDPDDALEAARRIKKKLSGNVRSVVYLEEHQKSNGKRRVIINGEVYASINKAADACRVSAFTMRKWIECGKATFAES